MWAEYQAKSIREHSYEMFVDLLSVSNLKDAAQGEKARQNYSQQIDRYKSEEADLSKEARALEQEVALEEKRATRFDLGEVCVEGALVITSITLLTRKRLYWHIGSALGLVGVGIALSGFLVR